MNIMNGYALCRGYYKHKWNINNAALSLHALLFIGTLHVHQRDETFPTPKSDLASFRPNSLLYLLSHKLLQRSNYTSVKLLQEEK